ncbi:transcriptional regulator TACO1-like protein [Clohesyomyces aquaticus]|uniref:Transcriptional regulator TACO1-like protein n=1 Tax=Clohesyomyces aquaticus TaxID=1231657 RepID=A0A1Y1YZX7_9PLEO|nr:transcriptional regulator TACO1-like protein [Clohesyomyces aquaticus]
MRVYPNKNLALNDCRKWASIKHDKAKNDAGKSKQRVLMTRDISNAVKRRCIYPAHIPQANQYTVGGPDPNMNPRLALAISTAKKNAVPKATIEAAVARGQGLSASGAALENVTLEAMMPPSIATVIECQTDNKLRALSDIRLIIKEAGGTVSSIGYMFAKKGRIILQKKAGIGADEVLEEALEVGALDVVEDDEGRVVVYTEPAEMKTTAETLAGKLAMEIEESDIIWDPNEDTMVPLDDEEAAQKLSEFLDDLQEVQGIQGVYTNWAKGAVSEEVWVDLRSKVAV